MNKWMTKKPILAVLALVLCLSAVVGGAMAYFTDYEDAAGGAVLHLGGETQIEEGSDTRNKHIVITNTGETNVIARAAIFGNNNDEYMKVTAGQGWIKSGDFYYYNKVLKPQEQTSPIDAVLDVQWKGTEKPKIDFEIMVTHESAQAIYDMDSKKLVVPEEWDPGAVAQIESVTELQAAGTHS